MNALTRAAVVSVAAVSMSLLFSPPPASAQGGPCAPDLAKFCKNVQRGGGRILKCLAEHEANLSPACKKGLAKMRAAGRGRGNVCRADLEKFCKNVAPGGGRIFKCLEENSSKLSPACKEHVAKMKAAGFPRRGPGAAGRPMMRAEKCKPDIEKFCKDVPHRGGRVIECLKQHESELSPACKATFAK